MSDFSDAAQGIARQYAWLSTLPAEYALTVACAREPFWLFLAWRRGVDHRSLTSPT